MRVRGTLLLFVVALAAIAALWWFGAGGDAAPPRSAERSAAATEESPAAPAATSLTAPTATATDAAPRNDQRTAGTTTSSEAATKNAVIRGRCVDEAGTPIAGCKIKAHGLSGSQNRMEAWRRDHPEPEWKDVERTTAADGRFAIEFWPPPPFQFLLEVRNGDHVPLYARWSSIAEGATVDVGDVTMMRGVVVQGTVVDETGAAVEKVQVAIRSTGRNGRGFGDGRPTPHDGHGLSDRAGRFRCSSAVAPGSYDIDVGSRHLAKPLRVALEPTRPIEELTIVVRAKDEHAEIRGKVVDDTGQPVAGAEVRTDGPCLTLSNRDGTFVLQNHAPMAVDKVTVFATHAAHEPAQPAAAVAWGSTNVVLTMQRGSALAVYAFDEARQPLNDFTVRVLPRDTDRFSSTDSDVRARGPFAAGFASVVGVGRGKWTVVAEFPSRERRTTVFAPIEVTALGAMRVDLSAPRDVQRVVRVVNAAGAPVAGSKVQLCMPLGETFDDRSSILGTEQFWWSSGNKALLLGDGITAADGRVALAGPPDRSLAVNAPGPGHVPVRVGPLPWTPEPELVITVATGARLHGRVGPPEALAEMRRLGGERADPKTAGIQLMRGSGRTTEQLPRPTETEQFTLDERGAFDIGGLPPGEWTVAVTYTQEMARMAIGKTLPVGTVVLRDGESTQLDPDASAILPGTVTGTLAKNGVPCADAQLHLEGWLPGQTEKHATDHLSVQTDADGRFTTRVRPGTWRARVTTQSGGRRSSFRCAETATVIVGQATHCDFTVWTGSLSVTLRDAAGSPAADVEIDAVFEGSDERAALPKTDASGASANEVGAGTLRFRVLPKRLQSNDARTKLWQESREKNVPWDTVLAPLWIDLGIAVVTNTAPTTIELRLPPAFEK